ncbi:MAG: sensor histidine kinase [Chitinophagaceae bacterium]|nr:MAG: sensor histidine kinase [Chitinophagaceae bacterium]
MFKSVSKYWWCQITGWSANIAISMFFVITFGQPSWTYFTSLVCTCIMGIVVTHIMRLNIFYLRVLEKPLKKQILYFLFLTIIFSVILGFISESIDYLIGYNPERLQKFSRPERLFLSSFNALWLVLIWNLIYFIYHYVESNRRQQMDTIRLESLVKSLELQTIKSHINPHFIFNALNSIRALVDENPERARTAITELSNILRSSLQTEKMETVPLAQELAIVKDYLALEQMRFEERLKVELEIEEDTLYQPVPPMMLQTLVENAIKHGISKKIDGGKIKIISRFINHHHELTVLNTGNLNGKFAAEIPGFGLKSTQDRLNLLYQGKANFEIKDTDGGMVQSKIIMPVSTVL